MRTKDCHHAPDSETELLHDQNPEDSEAEAREKRRFRTAKEASQLLEQLRKAYQSLIPKEQGEVRKFLSDVLESQLRFHGSRSRH